MRPLILVAIAAVLCGCPDPTAPSAEATADRDAAWKTHEPALKTLSEQLPKLAGEATKQEKLSAAKWEVKEPLNCRAGTEGYNALVVQVEDLGEAKAPYQLDLGDAGTLPIVRQIKAGQVPAEVADMAAAAGLRFALLVRVHEVKGPVVPDGDASKAKPGFVRGDVLIYDLKDGASKGGFPFEGKNATEVKAGVEDAGQWLRDDLFRNTRRAIHDGIEAQGEGNTGPLGSDDQLR